MDMVYFWSGEIVSQVDKQTLLLLQGISSYVILIEDLSRSKSCIHNLCLREESMLQ